MSLPDLIEIIPLTKPVQAEITVPGSKSITNRALILAALAEGEVTLPGALWSEDTQVMVDCLQKLGFEIQVKPEPEEFCNRTITVKGLGGKIPNAGTAEKPLELFVGNAGTAARFLSALVCLGNGVYRLSGVPRMHERPQAALFSALRELGYRVDSPNEKMPAIFYGSGPKPGATCGVSVEESSQFASALVLCMPVGGWEVGLLDSNPEELPYVEMTSSLINVFPKSGGTFQIEPDASSGSYFLAGGKLAPPTPEFMEYSEHLKMEARTVILSSAKVVNWPTSGWQIDARFENFLTVGSLLHGFVEVEKLGKKLDAKSVMEIARKYPQSKISRTADLGDSIMTAIVFTSLQSINFPFNEKLDFTDLGRLRLQECERVVALRTELTKCGAKVIEEGDTLTVYPSQLHGAEIETYNDHRMAMCFAVLGLKVPGIRIRNPLCVKKTFPNFFQKLAATPPHGLGAEIWEVVDGQRTRQLFGDDLFAD